MRPRLTPPFVVTMILFAVLFLIVMTAARAQVFTHTCNGTELCVAWKQITTYNNGASIPPNKVVVYSVFSVGDSIQRAQTTTLDVKITGLKPGNRCVVVLAQVMGDGLMGTPDDPGPQSDPSSSKCKMIKLPAPSDGRIESPTDGGIENH